MQEENLFQLALSRKNLKRPPIWMMRQAGRYHSHYQKLRQQYSFVDLCKIPELACEATLGPVMDFGLDAAILFSDLLFPLEVLGMGLKYDEGPILDFHLRNIGDMNQLEGGIERADQLLFQQKAIQLIRKSLPPTKGLIGFIGGPFTLFCYAVEGKHQGDLKDTRLGLSDGRYSAFIEKILDLLAANMSLQAQGGADTIAIFDTCAGEVIPEVYREMVVPSLNELIKKFHQIFPNKPVIYYSKNTGPEHWDALKDLDISCLGIDWNHDLADVLMHWSERWAIQGNVDPAWLLLESVELERRLRHVLGRIKALPASVRRGWICGLGHGVLPQTPESHVRLFLRIQGEIFGNENEV